MAIRLPLQVVLSATNNDEVGAGSLLGGIAIPFTVPQDSDNVVVKFQACTVGGAVSAVFQTTDDGGTTWYDVGRTSIVSNSAVGPLAEWLSIPVVSAGVGTSAIQTTSSVYVGSIGNAGASTLGAQEMSGLPLLSQQARIFLRITGNITTSSITTQVKVNSQSASA